MSETETIIRIEELQILLNKFDYYKFTFPIFPNFQLLEASPVDSGYKIQINNVDFDKFFTRFGQKESEFPIFNDFKECFLASGCITYINATKFDKIYNNYKNSHKKVYFALDTNILYHHYISSSPLIDDKVLITPTIKEEIKAAMNYRYQPYQINELKSKIKFNKNLIDELSNGRMKKSRKAAYLAMLELKKINSIEAEAINYDINGYEKIDLKIIVELKNFEQKTGASVVVLTADRTMIDFCIMENLDYFLFDYPPKIDVNQCSARKFRDLIFNIAAVFGFIKLNTTIIFGEFRGKHELDELKIRFLNKEIFKEFQKDLKTCRRLMDIDIDF